jgi:hypothetical protein
MLSLIRLYLEFNLATKLHLKDGHLDNFILDATQSMLWLVDFGCITKTDSDLHTFLSEAKDNLWQNSEEVRKNKYIRATPLLTSHRYQVILWTFQLIFNRKLTKENC